MYTMYLCAWGRSRNSSSWGRDVSTRGGVNPPNKSHRVYIKKDRKRQRYWHSGHTQQSLSGSAHTLSPCEREFFTHYSKQKETIHQKLKMKSSFPAFSTTFSQMKTVTSTQNIHQSWGIFPTQVNQLATFPLRNSFRISSTFCRSR